MKLKFKSRQRREFERIEKLGRWHQIFAWYPRKIDNGDGTFDMVWLQKVARKCTIHAKEKEGSYDRYVIYQPVYKLPEDTTVELLSNGDDSINFDDYGARSHYRSLKSDLGIQND